MNAESPSRPAGTIVALGLIYGAGAGTVIGLIVAGGVGIAMGGAIGAGLGLVAGAALEQWSLRPQPPTPVVSPGAPGARR